MWPCVSRLDLWVSFGCEFGNVPILSKAGLLMQSETQTSDGAGQSVVRYFIDWLRDLDWSVLQQILENTATQIWEILQLPGSEFWSAIAGAVVGGLIAFWIQNKALVEARNERSIERLQAEKALAYSLLFKVIKIYSNLEHIRRHVDTQRTLHEETTRPSGYLLALANLPSAIEFSADEMSMLLSIQNDEIFNSILSLDSIHNSIMPVWELYAALREKVKMLSQTIQFDPTVGRSEIEVKNDSPLAVAIFEADQMATELVRRAYEDATEAKQALEELIACFRAKFGFTIDIHDAKDRTANQVAGEEIRHAPQAAWPKMLSYTLHYN